jgi:hypothetical protein
MNGKRKTSNDGIVPNDGTYLGAKKGKALREKRIKEEFDEMWNSQKTLLKDSQVKLYKDRTSIGLQWQSFIDYDNSFLAVPKRVRKALNNLGKGKFPLTSEAVKRAVAIAQEIDLAIKANKFSWQDYPQWLPDELKPKKLESEKPKTIEEWIKEYETDYWSRKSQDKTSKQYYRDERNWKKGKLDYIKRVADTKAIPCKEVFDEVCKNYPKSRKRNECCSAIKTFAHFCGLIDYDNKEYRLKKHQIEVRAKKLKRQLSEQEVEEWFNKFPQWDGNESQKNQRKLWQWMYGMMATYGFRNHEVLNIYNLDETYIDEHGKPHYPFIDPILNPRGTIYTEGKGVKRAAFLPQPRKWIEQFNLRDVPQDYWRFRDEIKRLSGYEQEKAKQSKIHTFINFLREHDFTFTAYNLRHAYNVKSHGLGIPITLIAQNLGHNVLQNTTTYLETMGLQSALDALDAWEKRQEDIKDDELSLEAQIEALRQENEQLKAILQRLLESIKKE